MSITVVKPLLSSSLLSLALTACGAIMADTQKWLSPPDPLGDPRAFHRNPQVEPVEQRSTCARLVKEGERKPTLDAIKMQFEHLGDLPTPTQESQLRARVDRLWKSLRDSKGRIAVNIPAAKARMHVYEAWYPGGYYKNYFARVIDVAPGGVLFEMKSEGRYKNASTRYGATVDVTGYVERTWWFAITNSDSSDGNARFAGPKYIPLVRAFSPEQASRLGTGKDMFLMTILQPAEPDVNFHGERLGGHATAFSPSEEYRESITIRAKVVCATLYDARSYQVLHDFFIECWEQPGGSCTLVPPF